ncbi:MAG: shikimate dehydrogenase [Candidatus Omnitrophica bacterium]|nr:shikimate dehydrogenase [Candidatus Omnitrophota bacterium]
MKNVPTYGIIGYPLSHSLSPVMHNAAFEALGVEAIYKTFPLQDDEVEVFFENLRREDSPIFGLNVTVPYKEKVIPYLDTLAPFAKRAMAVNTVVISQDRKLTGYNTDGPGFLAHLTELKFDPRGKRVAILGAGGTTRAILTVLGLIPEKPEFIKIYNRTISTVEGLIRDLEQRVDMSNVEIVSSIEDLDIELADLLINTTSVGLNPRDPLLVPEEMLHSNLLVYDVIYNPAQTLLLKTAKKMGAKTANGLEMLFYQGVLAFQHWANVQLDADVKNKMRQSLREAIQNG